MRLDSANRSFFALVATALVPYLLLGVFGCGLLSVAGYRLVTEGLSGLDRDGQDLRPAVLFFALVTAGTLVGALSVRRQVRATRALAALLAGRTLEPPAELMAAIQDAGLDGRVDVVEDVEAFSFTYGLFSPRVVVSRGLVDGLGVEELAAVLHHERYHVHNWDTIKVVVARAAPAAFFFLPALRHLQARYLAGRELLADRRAIRAVGERPLVGALHRVLEQPAWSEFGAAAALGGAEFLDLRVTQLETGREPPLAPVPRWALTATAAGLGLMTAAFVTTLSATRGNAGMMGESGMMGGSTLLGLLGGVACSLGWVAVGWVVWRRVMGHRRLTPSPPGSTNHK